MSVELLNELEKVEVLWETLESKLPQAISKLRQRSEPKFVEVLACYEDRLAIVRRISSNIKNINDEIAMVMDSGNVRLASVLKKIARKKRSEEQWDFEDEYYDVDTETWVHKKVRGFGYTKDGPPKTEPGIYVDFDGTDLDATSPKKSMWDKVEGKLLTYLFPVALAVGALSVLGIGILGNRDKRKQLKAIKDLRMQLAIHAKAMNSLKEAISSSSVRAYISSMQELDQNLEIEEVLIQQISSFRY